MKGTVLAFVSLAFLTGCAGGTIADPSNRPPSTVAFEGTDALLYVDIADETGEQRRGLMGVEHLPADQGMAFVFHEAVNSTFWMKETLIPLSIAFVDENGRVIGLRDMEPCQSDPCPSYGVAEPYVLAIEANLGWFVEHGIESGNRAKLRVSAYG
jgi:uncharacterized membrane protein (UPF0127 family)